MNESIRQAAQRILANMQYTFGSGGFTYLPAREPDFRHLDLGAYRRFQSDHETQRFRHLCDMEIAEITASPTTLVARTFIRCMASMHGTVVGEYYQVRPRMSRLLRLLLRGLVNGRWVDSPKFFFRTLKTKHCVGYTTELSNGHFLTTSNAQSAGNIESPPTIDSEFHPYGTPGRIVMERHFERLKALLQASPGLGPHRLSSEDELLESWRRMKRQKDAFRAAKQWVSQPELEKMSSGHPELAAAVYEEIRRQLSMGMGVESQAGD